MGTIEILIIISVIVLSTSQSLHKNHDQYPSYPLFSVAEKDTRKIFTVTTENDSRRKIAAAGCETEKCMNKVMFELGSREGVLRASTLCALLGDDRRFQDCAEDALRKMFRPLCETQANPAICMSRTMPRLFRRIPLLPDAIENMFDIDDTCTLHKSESPFLGSLSCCADRSDILGCVAESIKKIARQRKLSSKLQDSLLKFRHKCNDRSNEQKKRVAFVEMTTSHSELLGVLTELFEGWTMDAYINTKNAHHSSLNAFRGRIDHVFEDASSFLQSETHGREYDAIVFLTGSQWWSLPYETRTSWRSKTVLIVHYLWEILELSSSGTVLLPLSPLFSDITKVHALPVFTTSQLSIANANQRIKNVILILGMRAEQIDSEGYVFKSKDLDDLERFIESLESSSSSLKIWLIAKDVLHLSAVLKPLLHSYPERFVWKSNCDSDCLEDVMHNRARYVHVLSSPGDSYHRFRLTASIPMALSHGVPMIISQDLATLYGIRSASLVYEHSSSQVIPKLLEMAEPSSHKSKSLAAFGLRTVFMRRTKQLFWGLY